MANIFINREGVGIISREEHLNRFAYDPDIAASQAVSLLMPVSGGPYLAGRPAALLPIFDMSLPEGALREALMGMFAKALPAMDDLALFQIVGRSLIGRVRFAQSAAELDQAPAYDLAHLLESRGTNELFADLLSRFAQYSGVAGVQPKVLVRDVGTRRLTAQGTTHLVKSFDAAKYPGLAANELICLSAARRAGLDVPNTDIANDGRVLAIERFDLKADGSYLAFEDGCALTGRIARDKYEGSYEQLAATFGQVVRSERGTAAELSRFFRSLVLTILVRNGDAHRKNFGVVYDDATGAVTLAPTFDVITTRAYLLQDSLALTLEGSKRWPNRKRLERFGVGRCQLTPSAARSIVDEVVDAVAETIAELDRFADRDPAGGETAERMKVAWNDGIASLRPSAVEQ